ncbi:MAG TPA: molybdopterin-dependent oxidoreductase [Gaiellales bacterium]
MARTLPERLFARLERFRLGPMREGAFKSTLHDERVATILGLALGVCFSVCFATGLVSHLVQRGPDWWRESWPTDPVSLYRITQGVHVLTGFAAIPLLLVKLWAVYPKLFAWPPFTTITQAVERASVALLIGGATFQLTTGVMNVFYWYPWGFNFPNAHFAGAWIAIGGLVTHIGAKWAIAREALHRPLAPQPEQSGVGAITGGLSRRGLLLTAGAGSGIVLVATAGSAVGPLSRLAILAPRRAGVGPQGLPVNHAATAAIIEAGRDPAYRILVTGHVAHPLALSLADLRAFPQRRETLPITCVEGWSTSADWEGIALRDILDRAGAAHAARIEVVSFQKRSGSSSSLLFPNHARDPRTLIALRLNGEELHPDHGYPARLIAPDRPGTEQTKWVHELRVI